MREIKATYGTARIAGIDASDGELTRQRCRDLVEPFTNQTLADPDCAKGLASIFAWFATNETELRPASEAEFPDSHHQIFTLTRNNWHLFASIHKDGAEVGSICREIRIKDSEARHWRLVLGDEAQNEGLGRELLARSIVLYDQLGLKRITLSAGGPVGAELWARVGFDFTSRQKHAAKLQLDGWAERLDYMPELPLDFSAAIVHGLVATDNRERSIREVLIDANPETAEFPEIRESLVRGPLTNNRVNCDIPRPLGHCLLFMLAEWEGFTLLDENSEQGMQLRSFLHR